MAKVKMAGVIVGFLAAMNALMIASYRVKNCSIRRRPSSLNAHEVINTIYVICASRQMLIDQLIGILHKVCCKTYVTFLGCGNLSVKLVSLRLYLKYNPWLLDVLSASVYTEMTQ